MKFAESLFNKLISPVQSLYRFLHIKYFPSINLKTLPLDITVEIRHLFAVSKLRLFSSRELSESIVRAKDDITVIIPVKDIDPNAFTICLKSLRNQTYDGNLIEIMLIDYDSAEKYSEIYKDFCKKYRVSYLRVDNRPLWSRSNSLNIGIKKVVTKYLLMSDADLIFDRKYIELCIAELKINPFKIIVNEMLDLPEMDVRNQDIDYLRSFGKPRLHLKYHPSIIATLTHYVTKIRGYDEYYKCWGSEDDDLFKRLKYLGLEVRSLKGRTFFLHQYHRKFRMDENIVKPFIINNRRYYYRTNSIVRNPVRWGE